MNINNEIEIIELVANGYGIMRTFHICLPILHGTYILLIESANGDDIPDTISYDVKTYYYGIIQPSISIQATKMDCVENTVVKKFEINISDFRKYKNPGESKMTVNLLRSIDCSQFHLYSRCRNNDPGVRSWFNSVTEPDNKFGLLDPFLSYAIMEYKSIPYEEGIELSSINS